MINFDYYEPGEDSYTLLDSIENENIKEKVVIDLGCSTGIITNSLIQKNIVLSIDLNLKALLNFKEIKIKNLIKMDLLKNINQKKIDIVIFNPPYVPDYDCPILGGNKFGRDVIDKFIEIITVKIFYLLIIEANKPYEVINNIKKKGYEVNVIKIRKIIGETIIILKCNKY